MCLPARAVRWLFDTLVIEPARWWGHVLESLAASAQTHIADCLHSFTARCTRVVHWLYRKLPRALDAAIDALLAPLRTVRRVIEPPINFVGRQLQRLSAALGHSRDYITDLLERSVRAVGRALRYVWNECCWLGRSIRSLWTRCTSAIQRTATYAKSVVRRFVLDPLRDSWNWCVRTQSRVRSWLWRLACDATDMVLVRPLRRFVFDPLRDSWNWCVRTQSRVRSWLWRLACDATDMVLVRPLRFGGRCVRSIARGALDLCRAHVLPACERFYRSALVPLGDRVVRGIEFVCRPVARWVRLAVRYSIVRPLDATWNYVLVPLWRNAMAVQRSIVRTVLAWSLVQSVIGAAVLVYYTLVPRKGVSRSGYSVDVRPGVLLPPRSADESALVRMTDGAQYVISVRNDTIGVAHCVLMVDGTQVGRLRLEPNSSYTIERPIENEIYQRFTFVREGSRAFVDAGKVPAVASNGLVQATFIPTVIATMPPRRARSSVACDVLTSKRKKAIVQRNEVACAASSGWGFTTSTVVESTVEVDDNELLLDGTEEDLAAGATIYSGISRQTFFGVTYDDNLAGPEHHVVLRLRLVAANNADDDSRAAPAPAPAPAPAAPARYVPSAVAYMPTATATSTSTSSSSSKRPSFEEFD